MPSTYPDTIDQTSTPCVSMSLREITDATEDRWTNDLDAIEPSDVYRQTSVDAFGGSLFGTDESCFGPSPSSSFSSSFSFGSSDSLWSAVNQAKEARAIPKAPQPLQACLSLASNFSNMSGDELSDTVEPWSMATGSRFDFGFSGALRDTCLYHVPREFLPSDADSDSNFGDDSESDTDSDSVDESATAVDTDGERSEGGGEASDTETVCGDEDEPEPVSAVWDREPSPHPISPAQASSEFLASSWLPDAWAPATPVRIVPSYPRRSARVPRPTVSAANHEEIKTPPTRKRPAPKKAKSPHPRKWRSWGRPISPRLAVLVLHRPRVAGRISRG
ncbi:hypothetical protein FB451DRAFT_1368032 [Mycena latifolia]|nr:hypothetical protein FB451DRAFT_1368032 [Mycena latifolia]